jgi:3-oxoacyl-[acyl-carrier protein] reductase
MTKIAVILGAGPAEGLSAVVETISASGGKATAIVADATDLSSLNTLIEQADAIGAIDLAIYNAGNNLPGDFLTNKAEYFENAWTLELDLRTHKGNF